MCRYSDICQPEIGREKSAEGKSFVGSAGNIFSEIKRNGRGNVCGNVLSGIYRGIQDKKKIQIASAGFFLYIINAWMRWIVFLSEQKYVIRDGWRQI